MKILIRMLNVDTTFIYDKDILKIWGVVEDGVGGSILPPVV